MRDFLIKAIAIICFISFIFTSKSFSQDNETTKNLPLLTFANDHFSSILDSIISYSINCDKNSLKQLKFIINIRVVNLNTAQVYISFINCQGFDFILRSTEPRMSAFGYFEYQGYLFIVTGQCDYIDLFHTTKTQKIFPLTTSAYLWLADYTTWIYLYDSDGRFWLQEFNPLSNNSDLYPICNEIIVK
jgi:hypothetical protein